jgi:hypothetical protein
VARTILTRVPHRSKSAAISSTSGPRRC